MVKTDLMMGRIKSAEDGQTRTFRFLATQYLQLADIKRQSSYSWKQTAIKNRFFPVFGTKVLGGLSTTHIEAYRDNRRLAPGLQGTSLKVSSLNRDLALLKHMFNLETAVGSQKSAQALGAPRKIKKCLITHKVTTNFLFHQAHQYLPRLFGAQLPFLG